jgi:hypothetical protein
MRRQPSVGVGTVPARQVLAGLLACLACTAIASGQAPDAGNQQSKGIALIARAELLQKLRAPDTGPFRLHASIKLFGLTQGNREGSYVLVAGGPALWFEQVRFPGYYELTGVSDGQSWRKRNVVDKPFRFHEVARLLSPAYHLELPPDAQITKLSQKEIRGVKALCVDASPTHEIWQKEMAGRAAMGQVGISKDSQVTLCFNADTGTLIGADYSAALPRYEYEGQVTLGNKVFPKILRCYEANELVVEATVQELVAEPPQDAAGFAPPAGAEKWPYCETPELPQMVQKKPMNEGLLAAGKVRRQFGTVLCLAEVGTDGLIHDFTWMQGRFGAMAGAVKEAVQEFRYKPGMCNGVPIPTVIYLAVVFPP